MNTKKHIKTTLQEFENNIWFHGSNKPIKKFLFSLIGKNNDRISNYHGYGIYFIDNINNAKKYGQIIITVHIDKNADILKDKITLKQLNKIYNQLIKEKFKLNNNDDKWFQNPTYDKYSVLNNVEEFYDYLLRKWFKTIKDVTEFLLRSGIDAMQVTNDVDDNILVVFNENIIDIIKYD